MYSTAKKNETAVLVALITDTQDEPTTQVYLDELAFLATTLEIEVKKTFTQRLPRPHSATFLGKGKLEDLVMYVKANNIDMVIFDDDLQPSQVRNLEKELNGEKIEGAKVKILDRSLLILDIFAHRAQTTQAHTQVELAQYQYLLPRLTRMWTHLSKQKGGIGMRGPGEKELETDRRIVKDKISLLREKLLKIEQQSATRRKSRERMVRVALVGYTNVGKSTLMRLLSKADVFAENKLFATVDSTVRKVVLNDVPFLLTDTVGFIRKLPTLLIESFKSTLAEIVEADILLHIADLSSPHCYEQIDVVNQTLQEIGAGDKPTIIVFNKADLVNPEDAETWQAREYNYQHTLRISALQKQNIDQLRQMIYSLASEKFYAIYPNFLQRPIVENFETSE
jgi:GTP-binding protein HflX